jgi:hypothetical protein
LKLTARFKVKDKTRCVNLKQATATLVVVHGSSIRRELDQGLSVALVPRLLTRGGKDGQQRMSAPKNVVRDVATDTPDKDRYPVGENGNAISRFTVCKTEEVLRRLEELESPPDELKSDAQYAYQQ